MKLFQKCDFCQKKTYIGVQRFVGDAKQTLEIRVERRRNRQGGGCFGSIYLILLLKTSSDLSYYI